MENKPELSVIVPVYKVEPYLQKCIDSILAQTFRDLELILVDDGSPDNCPAICDAAAEKDERVVVLHRKNAGLSAARNAGLSIAGAIMSALWTAMTISPRRCTRPFMMRW